jgi:hypothetical protein
MFGCFGGWGLAVIILWATPGDLTTRIQLGGLVLQMGAAAAAGLQLSSLRKTFGIVSTPRRFAAWCRGWLQVVRSRRSITAHLMAGNVTVSGSVAGMAVHSRALDQQSELSRRLAALETKLIRFSQKTDAELVQVNQDVTGLAEELGASLRTTQEDVKALNRQNRDASIGSLDAAIVGLLWLAPGLAMATAPGVFVHATELFYQLRGFIGGMT